MQVRPVFHRQASPLLSSKPRTLMIKVLTLVYYWRLLNNLPFELRDAASVSLPAFNALLNTHVFSLICLTFTLLSHCGAYEFTF